MRGAYISAGTDSINAVRRKASHRCRHLPAYPGPSSTWQLEYYILRNYNLKIDARNVGILGDDLFARDPLRH
jgi:hypothetical protein